MSQAYYGGGGCCFLISIVFFCLSFIFWYDYVYFWVFISISTVAFIFACFAMAAARRQRMLYLMQHHDDCHPHHHQTTYVVSDGYQQQQGYGVSLRGLFVFKTQLNASRLLFFSNSLFMSARPNLSTNRTSHNKDISSRTIR